MPFGETGATAAAGSGGPRAPASHFVLLVPDELPRPKAALQRDRLRASVLTPFTLVVDVPLYAIYIVIVFPYAYLYTDGFTHSGC